MSKLRVKKVLKKLIFKLRKAIQIKCLPCVAHVRMIIDGRSAGVPVNSFSIFRVKFVFLTGHRIIQLQNGVNHRKLSFSSTLRNF